MAKFDALESAICQNDVVQVKKLFKPRKLAFLNLPSKYKVDSKGKDGLTPLHVAAMYENTEVIQYLICEGADISIKTKQGLTPLHCAVQRSGNTDVIKLLVNKGADIKAQDTQGATVIHLACISSGLMLSNDQNIRCLVELGADVNARDNEGATPLHYAASLTPSPIESPFSFGVKTVTSLVGWGANIDAVDSKGLTPLHYAVAIAERKDITKIILAQRPNIDAVGDAGITALGYAAKNKNIELMTMLIENGAQKGHDKHEL